MHEHALLDTIYTVATCCSFVCNVPIGTNGHENINDLRVAHECGEITRWAATFETNKDATQSFLHELSLRTSSSATALEHLLMVPTQPLRKFAGNRFVITVLTHIRLDPFSDLFEIKMAGGLKRNGYRPRPRGSGNGRKAASGKSWKSS